MLLPDHPTRPAPVYQISPTRQPSGSLPIKKTWSKLRLGLLLAVIAAGLAGCGNPTAAHPAQSSPTPARSQGGMITGSPTRIISNAQDLQIGSTQISPKDGMVMVYVPQGSFRMGSDKAKDTQAQNDELPHHSVYLDAYWIDRTEVTNARYARCVKDGQCTLPKDTTSSTHLPYYGSSQFDAYPVIYVDWEQAQAYCKWAGRRLPSEAEWEKAARGEDGRIFPWGDLPPNESKVNYNLIYVDTTAAGSLPAGASPYGALDMAGNVWEWVNDWYSDLYYRQSPERNPAGPAAGTDRVVRGGSWLGYDWFVRSAIRGRYAPDFADNAFGFRCAASLPD